MTNDQNDFNPKGITRNENDQNDLDTKWPWAKIITQKYIPLEDPRSYFLCLTNLYLWSEEHNCISKTYQQENMGQAKPERKWLYKKESDLSERKKKGAIHEDSSFYIYIIFFASIT